MDIGKSVAVRSCGAKRSRPYARKTKNGKTLLFAQQLQLTTKQIDTKIGNMAFLDFEFITVKFFSHF